MPETKFRSFRVDAVVLRHSDYGEADRLLTLYTRQLGKTRALAKGETSVGELIRIQCFDGSFKTIINSAAPLRDEGGRVTGAIVVNEDITALHEAQEKQRASEQLLRTVIDLRSSEEITREPNPFAALPGVVSYVHQPLNDPATESRLSVTASAVRGFSDW